MGVTVATVTPYLFNADIFSASNYLLLSHWLTSGFSSTCVGSYGSFLLSLYSGTMDLMDAHIQCSICLGIDHLTEALIDPCPECSLMSLEVRQHRPAKLDPELKNSAPPAGTALQAFGQ